MPPTCASACCPPPPQPSPPRWARPVAWSLVQQAAPPSCLFGGAARSATQWLARWCSRQLFGRPANACMLCLGAATCCARRWQLVLAAQLCPGPLPSGAAPARDWVGVRVSVCGRHVWMPPYDWFLAQLTALQIGAISVSTPQRRPRSFWNTSTTGKGEGRGLPCWVCVFGPGPGSCCQAGTWLLHTTCLAGPCPSTGLLWTDCICPACIVNEPERVSLCLPLPAVTLAPTQLGALDCICLDYRVGWPLSAILPEVRRRAGGGTSAECAQPSGQTDGRGWRGAGRRPLGVALHGRCRMESW